jgi:hypothetical protein
MARPALTIDTLPLFSDDESIGEAVLRRDRAGEFKGLATLLEPEGMPTVSPFWGGRYVLGVKAFLDKMQGVTDTKPLKEDGREGQWSTNKPDRKARA